MSEPTVRRGTLSARFVVSCVPSALTRRYLSRHTNTILISCSQMFTKTIERVAHILRYSQKTIFPPLVFVTVVVDVKKIYK